MDTYDCGEVPLKSDLDIARVRQLIRQVSAASGFSVLKQTKLVTATSELARNAVKYGGGGVARWSVLGPERMGVKIVFEDQGPGIADIGLALSDGWSSGGSLGLGLPGTRRLVDEFELSTTVGAGTRVEITMWK